MRSAEVLWKITLGIRDKTVLLLLGVKQSAKFDLNAFRQEMWRTKNWQE